MFDVYIDTYGFDYTRNFCVKAQVNEFTLDSLLNSSHASSDMVRLMKEDLAKGKDTSVFFEARGGKSYISIKPL